MALTPFTIDKNKTESRQRGNAIMEQLIEFVSYRQSNTDSFISRGPYTFWNTYALGFQLSAVQLVLLRAIIGTGSSQDSEAELCSWCSEFGIWNTTPYTQKLFQYLTVPNFVRYSMHYAFVLRDKFRKEACIVYSNISLQNQFGLSESYYIFKVIYKSIHSIFNQMDLLQSQLILILILIKGPVDPQSCL